MASSNERIERRQHKRFRLQENVFVVVTDRVGPLFDISASGLSFFVDADEHLAKGKTFHLDIFGADSSFTLKDIPFQVVSEIMVNPNSPFSVVTRKRYGVQFGELSAAQRSGLEYFIQFRSVGNA